MEYKKKSELTPSGNQAWPHQPPPIPTRLSSTLQNDLLTRIFLSSTYSQNKHTNKMLIKWAQLRIIPLRPASLFLLIASPDHPLTLPYRVRTLTGKEIELDIEPDYKVSYLPVQQKKSIKISLKSPRYPTVVSSQNYSNHDNPLTHPPTLPPTSTINSPNMIWTGRPDKRACRRKRRHPPSPTTTYLWRKTNVPSLLSISPQPRKSKFRF